MTQEEIIADSNFLSSLVLPDNNVSLYLVYTGSHKPLYYMFYNGELLFQGNDFRPSPLYAIDSLDTTISLFNFLCCKEGDVDRDYFKDYTAAQLLWTRSPDCETIGGLVGDYNNISTDSEANLYRLEAKQYFEDHFTT